MFRRVFLLSGLAILAVVVNHASYTTEMTMFWWVDRYRPVPVPNFDLDATLPYYLVIMQRKLALFGVPSFLFFSGFFLSYAASGTSGLSWKTVRARVLALLIPFAIWSAVRLARAFLEGTTYTPSELATSLLLGWPTGIVYWYVPVICFYYLISPFLIRFAKKRPYLLLLIAGLLHWIAVSFEYLRLGQDLLGINAPWLDTLLGLYTSLPMHFIMLFFFVLGIVAGLRRKEFASHLAGHSWHLLIAVVVLGALAVYEGELVYRATSLDWRSGVGTIPSSLCALAIILLFLAMGAIPKPISKVFHKLGTRMFGIYLLHGFILEFSARATQKFTPPLLANPVLFQFVIVLSAVIGCLLIMEAVSRSPLRKYQKYLFG